MKSIASIRFAAIAALWLAAHSVGHAVVLTSVSATALSTNIVASQPTTDGNAIMWKDTASPVIGQTFTLSTTSTLLSFSLFVRAYESPFGLSTPPAFDLSLVSFPDASSLAPGAIIATDSGSIPNGTLLTSPAYVTFDFADITVGPGVYGLLLKYQPGGTDDVVFAISNASTYTGGVGVKQTLSPTVTTSVGTGPNSDLLFSVSAVAVPEPSSWALLALGLAAVGYRSRRRGETL